MSGPTREKKRQQALVSAVSSKAGGVYANIQRDETKYGVALDPSELPQADSVFAIDCGCAVIHEGYPELRLGQRHPLKPNLLTRLLVVRYTLDVFQSRARDNDTFREGLESWLAQAGPGARGEVGFFSQALKQAAESDPVPATVTVDADGEWMSRSGHRGAVVFISTTSLERFRAATGKSDTIWLYGPVEVTMNARTMADLLLSWKQTADAMSHRHSTEAHT